MAQTVKIVNIPTEWTGGSLWFVIPNRLQAYVGPWLRSLLPGPITTHSRRAYLDIIKAGASDEKYSDSIHAAAGESRFDFYQNYGVWRVGERGIDSATAKELEASILVSIESFADSEQMLSES